MIQNYLKIAFRNIRRNYVHTILNIAGMAIGMACVILILLWIQNEIRWDRCHKNADYIYRVIINHQYEDGPSRQEAFTPVPLAAALKDEYPEITASTRYASVGMLLQKGDEHISEQILFVDDDFFTMFDIEFVLGDFNSAFIGPYDVILTEEMARKYFGEEDPIGKTINAKEIVLTVSGVVKKMPENSSIQYGFILPFMTLMKPEMQTGLRNDWEYAYWASFIQLDKEADRKIVEDKIKNVLKEHIKDIKAEIYLQNLKMIHLHSARKFFGEPFYLGNIVYVRLGYLIAFLILTIACINYMNMITAQSAGRAREIGIRKMAGAGRRRIIFQFLGETLLLVFFAHIIAMILFELLLPGFNNLMQAQLEVNYLNSGLYVGLFIVIIFCGLLAGSYPALYMSSLNTLHIIKGGIINNTRTGKFRKVLVISQYTLSFIFILCSFIIRDQINYIQSVYTGYNMDNMGHFEFNEGIERSTLKNELNKNSDILSVTITGHQNILSIWTIASGLTWKGKSEGEGMEMSFLHADRDFIKTFNIELKQGRFLTEDEYSGENNDQIVNIIINEKAASYLGFENPIGEELKAWTGIKFRIIGVVKDFHFRILRYPIEPLIILPINTLTVGGTCYIRMKPGQLTAVVDDIKNIFKSYNLDYTLNFQYIEDEINNMYTVEKKAGTMLGIFSTLVIIISCLGLLGLASFMTERRTKEIGIRKANGANSSEIITLLSKEYIKLVLISFLIASPVAWYATNIWLQGFVYRTKVGWPIFALAFVVVILLTILTVGYQSYKAANRNPVEALRYE